MTRHEGDATEARSLPRGSRPVTPSANRTVQASGGRLTSPEQAVLVHLDARGLPQRVYDEYDVVTLEDKLEEALSGKGVGEYDGNEFGEGEVVLYLYGPDAERLFSVIEGALRGYPLCQSARVVIRGGEPGAPQRERRIRSLSLRPGEILRHGAMRRQRAEPDIKYAPNSGSLRSVVRFQTTTNPGRG